MKLEHEMSEEQWAASVDEMKRQLDAGEVDALDYHMAMGIPATGGSYQTPKASERQEGNEE